MLLSRLVDFKLLRVVPTTERGSEEGQVHDGPQRVDKGACSRVPRSGRSRSGVTPSDPLLWGRRLLFWLAIAAVAGAAALWVSVSRPNMAAASGSTSLRLVLVAVVGETGQPGFAGFVAHIDPNGRDLGVIPVSGLLPAQRPGDPLWTDAGLLSGPALLRAVRRDTHLNVQGYFLVNIGATEAVLQALNQDSPGWPKALAPDLVLKDLGWPYGQAARRHELLVLSDIVTYLPELASNQTPLLQTVLQGSETNLSTYEMFELATYIRGDTLQLQPLGGQTP